MSFEKKIDQLKLTLPEARDPVGSYVASKIIGKMLFISGQISIAENGELIKGKVGRELKTEDGYEAAKRRSRIYRNALCSKSINVKFRKRTISN